jgi:hypothetical protein
MLLVVLWRLDGSIQWSYYSGESTMAYRGRPAVYSANEVCQFENLEPRLMLSGSLTITDNVGNASDRSAAFADTVLGSSSTTATFSIANTGDAAVDISNLVAPGVGDNFDVIVLDGSGQSVTGSSFSIAAGQTYTIQATFNPVDSTGAKADTITFNSTAAGNASVSLAVSGTALTLGDGLHIIQVASPVIDGVQYVTYDIFLTSDYAWTNSAISMTLSQGSIYQNEDYGSDGPPSDYLIQLDGDVEWDTYFSTDAGDTPSFADSSFTTTSLSATWYKSPPYSTGCTDVRLARITVTADAVGTISGKWWSTDEAVEGVGVSYSATLPGPDLVVYDDEGSAGTSNTFPNCAVDDSITETFTITNTGINPLVVTNILKTDVGTPSDFTFVVKDNLGNTVTGDSFTVSSGAGNDYTIEVTFTPTTWGSHNGSITFNTNDDANLDVTLTFDGDTGPQAVLVVIDDSGTTTDKAVDFSLVSMGSTSQAKTFTISNAGTEPLAISEFHKVTSSASGDFTVVVRDNAGVVVSASSFTVAVGESYTVEVTFSPGAVDNRTASIAFSTDVAGHSSVTLSLSGTGYEGRFGTVNDKKGTKLVMTDADGTIVTFTLSGLGTGTVNMTDDGWQISYVNTDRFSSTKITTKKSRTVGDDGLASINSVTVSGALKAFSAATTSLTGDFTVADSLSVLTLDDCLAGSTISIGARVVGDIKTTLAVKMDHVQNATFTSLTPMSSLAVTNWLDNDATADTITAPSLAKLTASGNKKAHVDGDFQAGLSITGVGVAAGKSALGSATIKGDLSGAVWDIKGQAGNITVSGIASDSTLRTTLSMGKLSFAGLDTVNILAGIKASVTDFATLASDFLKPSASIKSITAAGLSGSNISATSIGSVKLTNSPDMISAGLAVIHVLNNTLTPKISPVSTISYSNKANPASNIKWKFGQPEPGILEII